MENYTLNYLHWESSLEEFGDDFVTFHFEVKPEGEEPFELFIQYSKFKKHMEQTNPDIFMLLEKAENSCTKWGPNESVYVKELESYGIDVGKLVLDMVPDAYDISAEIEHYRKLRANPPDLSNFLNEIQGPIAEIKKMNEIYYPLCEELEKILSQKIVELYPALLNSSSENITRLREILARRIPELAGDLYELIKKTEETAN